MDEINDPRKNLPKALLIGTVLVTVLYVLLQVVLLKHATYEQFTGKVEVAFISFANLLGADGGKWVSYFIAIQLIATACSFWVQESSMPWLRIIIYGDLSPKEYQRDSCKGTLATGHY